MAKKTRMQKTYEALRNTTLTADNYKHYLKMSLFHTYDATRGKSILEEAHTISESYALQVADARIIFSPTIF